MPRRQSPKRVTVTIAPDRIARLRSGRRAVAGEKVRVHEDEAAALVRDRFAEDPDASARREDPQEDHGSGLVF